MKGGLVYLGVDLLGNRAHTSGVMTDNSSNPLQDDDQMTKLFAYLDQRFGDLEDGFNQRFDRVERRLDTLEGVIDTLAADVSTLKDETLVRNHQLDRRLTQHENWITQLADHSHTTLEPQPER